MRAVNVANFINIAIALFTIYMISSQKPLTRFLNRGIILLTLNIAVQLLATHEDNSDPQSFVSLLLNTITDTFILSMGLVDIKILELFAVIDDRLTPRRIRNLRYLLFLSFFVLCTAAIISPGIYFLKDWDFRTEYLSYAFYVAGVFGTMGFVYTTAFYIYFSYTLYMVKKNVPGAIIIYSQMLRLCYTMFAIDFMALVSILCSVIIDSMYFEFNSLFSAFLGCHSFIQLALFLKAKKMALSKPKDQDEAATKSKLVMLVDAVKNNELQKVGDLDTVKIAVNQ